MPLQCFGVWPIDVGKALKMTSQIVRPEQIQHLTGSVVSLSVCILADAALRSRGVAVVKDHQL
jgi:hypothetical protein